MTFIEVLVSIGILAISGGGFVMAVVSAHSASDVTRQRDMVRAQAMLVERLGIEQLFCVMGGSMGAVVGEKLTRAVETAVDQQRPLIVVSASVMSMCGPLNTIRSRMVPRVGTRLTWTPSAFM